MITPNSVEPSPNLLLSFVSSSSFQANHQASSPKSPSRHGRSKTVTLRIVHVPPSPSSAVATSRSGHHKRSKTVSLRLPASYSSSSRSGSVAVVSREREPSSPPPPPPPPLSSADSDEQQQEKSGEQDSTAEPIDGSPVYEHAIDIQLPLEEESARPEADADSAHRAGWDLAFRLLSLCFVRLLLFLPFWALDEFEHLDGFDMPSLGLDRHGYNFDGNGVFAMRLRAWMCVLATRWVVVL